MWFVSGKAYYDDRHRFPIPLPLGPFEFEKDVYDWLKNLESFGTELSIQELSNSEQTHFGFTASILYELETYGAFLSRKKGNEISTFEERSLLRKAEHARRKANA